MNGGRNEEYILPADENEMKLVERNIKRLPRVNLRNYLTDDKQHARINGKVKDPGGKVMREYDQQFKIYMKENINGDLIGYRVTGMPFLVDKTNEFLATNIVMSLAIAFIIIAVIMGLLFQSYRMIIIAILPNLLPLLAIAGMMGLVGINIKISTSIIFAIAFGIAVDDTIHFLTRFRLEIQQGQPMETAILNTLKGTGKAMILTSLVLLGGFVILLVSDFGGTFNTGLFSGLTILFALIGDLVVLPVLVRMIWRG